MTQTEIANRNTPSGLEKMARMAGYTQDFDVLSTEFMRLPSYEDLGAGEKAQRQQDYAAFWRSRGQYFEPENLSQEMPKTKNPAESPGEYWQKRYDDYFTLVNTETDTFVDCYVSQPNGAQLDLLQGKFPKPGEAHYDSSLSEDVNKIAYLKMAREVNYCRMSEDIYSMSGELSIAILSGVAAITLGPMALAKAFFGVDLLPEIPPDGGTVALSLIGTIELLQGCIYYRMRKNRSKEITAESLGIMKTCDTIRHLEEGVLEKVLEEGGK